MVAAVSTDIKRLAVRRLAKTAVDAGTDLQSALEAFAFARFDEIKAGKILTSTSGNGKQVTFTPLVTQQPEEFTALCSELLDRHDAAKAHLVAAGNANPSVDEIKTEMLALLESIVEQYADFSGVGR